MGMGSFRGNLGCSLHFVYLLGPEDIQKICESFGGLGALVLESDSGVSLKFGVAGERLA